MVWNRYTLCLWITVTSTDQTCDPKEPGGLEEPEETRKVLPPQGCHLSPFPIPTRISFPSPYDEDEYHSKKF